MITRHTKFLALMIPGAMLVACTGDDMTDDTDDVPTVTARISTDNKLYMWDADTDGVPDINMGETPQQITTGEGRLIRFEKDIYGSVKFTGATPGHVYSMWWAIFNNPEACTSPGPISRCGVADFMVPGVDAALIVAGSNVAPADGVVNFASTMAVNDTTGLVVGSALKNPMTADVHLIIRTQGGEPKADMAEFIAQLTMFGEGPDAATSPHEGIHTRDFTGVVSKKDVYWWDSNMDGTQDGAAGQPGFQPIAGAYSLLIRDGDDVYATMNLKGLTPNHVITTWYGVFNNPAACVNPSVDGKLKCTIPDLMVAETNGSVMNSRAGAVVRADGSSIIAGLVKKGDLTAAQTGNGLTDPAKADIHVLARTHFEANTSSISAQMNDFNGGCTGPCPNLVVSGHEAEE